VPLVPPSEDLLDRHGLETTAFARAISPSEEILNGSAPFRSLVEGHQASHGLPAAGDHELLAGLDAG
jgi:hypothetical protein